MKDKIEEILGRHERDDVFGITQELLHLIQEERKKAKEEYIKVVWNEVCEKIKEDSVREFVKYMKKRKMSNFYIDELLEEYLESEK